MYCVVSFYQNWNDSKHTRGLTGGDGGVLGWGVGGWGGER